MLSFSTDAHYLFIYFIRLKIKANLTNQCVKDLYVSSNNAHEVGEVGGVGPVSRPFSSSIGD